jgi:hypothetical protein
MLTLALAMAAATPTAQPADRIDAPGPATAPATVAAPTVQKPAEDEQAQADARAPQLASSDRDEEVRSYGMRWWFLLGNFEFWKDSRAARGTSHRG